MRPRNWAQKDSDLRPSDYESPALPLSYGPKNLGYFQPIAKSPLEDELWTQNLILYNTILKGFWQDKNLGGISIFLLNKLRQPPILESCLKIGFS